MATEKPRISAFVITRNEAAKIGECLDSLAFLDEIVVVDDFSSDATPEICRAKGVNFQQHKFTGFKDQKCHAMNQAKNDWVLEIDADERVDQEMQRAILALTPEEMERCDCFEFKRKTRFWGKWIMHGSLYPDYKGRLYCRTRGAWSGANIHERFIVKGATRKLAGEILHPQDLDLYSYFLRTARYADLSAAEYFARGRRAKWHHVTVRPVTTFLTRFLIRLGFLDGVHGFVVAVMGGIGTFMKYMKLYEIQKKAAGELGTAGGE